MEDKNWSHQLKVEGFACDYGQRTGGVSNTYMAPYFQKQCFRYSQELGSWENANSNLNYTVWYDCQQNDAEHFNLVPREQNLDLSTF